MFIKPKITTSTIDKRKLCSFITNNPALGCITTTSRMDYNNGFKRLLIELKNKQNKILGFEELVLNSGTSEMTGLSIWVEPEYRKKGTKGFQFGEILRLASIINMLENNKKIFKIFSKNTAIYFHSKYKFEPNITNFQERNYALETITDENSPEFKDLAEYAKILLHKSNTDSNPANQRKLCFPANKITKEYIRRVEHMGKDEYKQHPFNRGMDMLLTYDEIMRNKAFFNQLFKKHNIDYTI